MSNAPVTTLDQRYSDQEAVAIGWHETLQVLRSAELFWISTVRPDGRPHVTPLVAVWVDGAIHFHTGSEEQKFANLRANPNVVLTTGCNRWDAGVDVVVEGVAVPVTDEETLTRLATAWAAKWDGRWRLEAHDGGFRNRTADGFPSLVFTVTPTKVFAHAKGDPFGHTTHSLRPLPSWHSPMEHIMLFRQSFLRAPVSSWSSRIKTAPDARPRPEILLWRTEPGRTLPRPRYPGEP